MYMVLDYQNLTKLWWVTLAKHYSQHYQEHGKHTLKLARPAHLLTISHYYKNLLS